MIIYSSVSLDMIKSPKEYQWEFCVFFRCILLHWRVFYPARIIINYIPHFYTYPYMAVCTHKSWLSESKIRVVFLKLKTFLIQWYTSRESLDALLCHHMHNFYIEQVFVEISQCENGQPFESNENLACFTRVVFFCLPPDNCKLI